MISIFGIAVTKNQELISSIRGVLETLAKNQSTRGQIPSLVHDPENRGSSDTTPLFLLGLGIFRKVTGENDFLNLVAEKAMSWMDHQSPTDKQLIAQQPTSDWRDEQWVLGYGLFVNALTYSYLRMLGYNERADLLQADMHHYTHASNLLQPHEHEGFIIKNKPYYALWTFKVFSSDRFDLLGNSFAILSGLASKSRAEDIISWIEDECDIMLKRGELKIGLPPNFFPFIKPDDSEWNPRYEIYNKPGDYHNGGIWPFVCGFYIAALVAAKKIDLAEEKLFELTELVKTSTDKSLTFGFNEWHKAQDGKPMGQDWQTWSAAMYLYAAKCVEEEKTPFFNQT
jgi:hypothetical protein